MSNKDEFGSLLKLIDELEDRLIALTPDKYRGVIKHFIKARLEVLRGIEELIRIRREELERKLSESQGPRKEKVDIE